MVLKSRTFDKRVFFQIKAATPKQLSRGSAWRWGHVCCHASCPVRAKIHEKLPEKKIIIDLLPFETYTTNKSISGALIYSKFYISPHNTPELSLLCLNEAFGCCCFEMICGRECLLMCSKMILILAFRTFASYIMVRNDTRITFP